MSNFEYSGLDKPAGDRLLMYRFRQCPDCEAHFFPKTIIHKCEVIYSFKNLRGEDNFVRIREDKILAKNGLFMLYNQDELGFKSYFVEEVIGSKTYEAISREDFIRMLQD